MKRGNRIPSGGAVAWLAAAAITLICAVAALGATAAAASADACPNEAIRIEQGVTSLPDCMALEQATPPDKGNIGAGTGGNVFPSFSLNGDRLLFASPAALGGTEGLENPPPKGDDYVASRGAGAWVTVALAPPASYGFGWGGAGGYGFPLSISPALDRWFSLQATVTEAQNGQVTPYRAGLADPWTPLAGLLTPTNRHYESGLIKESLTSYEANSADFTHLFFRPASPGFELGEGLKNYEASYLPGDPNPTTSPSTPATWNTYVVYQGPLGEQDMALLAHGADIEHGGAEKIFGGNCGTLVGGGGTSGRNGPRTQGAVSPSGIRVYFTTRPGQPVGTACSTANPLRILERREEGGETQIRELVPGGPAEGSDIYEGASEDQRRVYFTSPRKLTASDLDPGSGECSNVVKLPIHNSIGCDLYLYEKLPAGGHELIQVSAGGTSDPSPGEGADVYQGVTAISGDGSHVYFAAQGVLTTTPNPVGEVAAAGKLNLYAYRRDGQYPAGHLAFVGGLDAACTSVYAVGPDCASPVGAASASVVGATRSYLTDARAVPMLSAREQQGEVVGGEGGNGDVLVFETTASLVANDMDGNSADVYRYQADAEPPTLECVSCLPDGIADAGDFDVRERSIVTPSGSEFAELGSWVSEDGSSIVFATMEPLLPGARADQLNDYLWRAGQLHLLPGNGRNPSISHDGSEVAFEATNRLLPSDGDSAGDVYVAREDGGFPISAEPTPCAGEACQGQISAQPSSSPPASQTYAGPGNVQPSAGCPKGKVKRAGKCVKPNRQKKKQQKHHKKGRSK